MEFSKNVKSLQFPMVQGSLNPNIIFLHEKLWPVAWKQKNTSVIEGKNRKMPIKGIKMKISKNKKMNRGHPFTVSGIFLSTYHQGSVQKKVNAVNKYISYW